MYVYRLTYYTGGEETLPKRTKKFREILIDLINEKNITKTKFYTELDIKKPYFYDIISGKVNPPPPERQLDMIRILKPSKEKMVEFFNAAATERGEVPVDIVIQLQNKEIVDNLRKGINYEQILKNGDDKHD